MLDTKVWVLQSYSGNRNQPTSIAVEVVMKILAPMSLFLLVVISLSLAPSPVVPGRDPKCLHVLILTGYNMHAWRAITEALRSTLEATGRFGVRVNEEPVGCTERTFDGYDAIVLNLTNHAGVFGPTWPAETRRALMGVLDRGKG